MTELSPTAQAMREAYGGAGPWPLPIGETESSLHSSCRAVALSLSLGQATRPLGQATRAVALSHRAGPWLSPLVVASLLLAQRLLSLSLSAYEAQRVAFCAESAVALSTHRGLPSTRAACSRCPCTGLSPSLHWPLTVLAPASSVLSLSRSVRGAAGGVLRGVDHRGAAPGRALRPAEGRGGEGGGRTESQRGARSVGGPNAGGGGGGSGGGGGGGCSKQGLSASLMALIASDCGATRRRR